jgi:hypothetical protein
MKEYFWNRLINVIMAQGYITLAYLERAVIIMMMVIEGDDQKGNRAPFPSLYPSKVIGTSIWNHFFFKSSI